MMFKLRINEDLKNTTNNILNSMKDIEYGWLDIYGNTHDWNDFNSFYKDYVLQSPEQVLENKIGVCWDQVELERQLFEEQSIPFKTFFIEYNDGEGKPSHTFLLYRDNGNCYWFEHSWYDYKGIHLYTNEENALLDIKYKFIQSTEDEIEERCDLDNVLIYEYSKPDFGIGCEDFYLHCELTGTLYDI